MVIIEQESILISDSEEFFRMALRLSGLGTELQIGSQWFNPRANSSFLTEERVVEVEERDWRRMAGLQKLMNCIREEFCYCFS